MSHVTVEETSGEFGPPFDGHSPAEQQRIRMNCAEGGTEMPNQDSGMLDRYSCCGLDVQEFRATVSKFLTPHRLTPSGRRSLHALRCCRRADGADLADLRASDLRSGIVRPGQDAMRNSVRRVLSGTRPAPPPSVTAGPGSALASVGIQGT